MEMVTGVCLTSRGLMAGTGPSGARRPAQWLSREKCGKSCGRDEERTAETRVGTLGYEESSEKARGEKGPGKSAGEGEKVPSERADEEERGAENRFRSRATRIV